MPRPFESFTSPEDEHIHITGIANLITKRLSLTRQRLIRVQSLIHQSQMKRIVSQEEADKLIEEAAKQLGELI